MFYHTKWNNFMGALPCKKVFTSVDTDTLKRLGMYLTCEPAYEQEDRKYHKL